jgi:hypothetical protein
MLEWLYQKFSEQTQISCMEPEKWNPTVQVSEKE